MRLNSLTFFIAIMVANPIAAEQHGACHLFATEDQFVTQTLYMQLEDARHTLTIPEIYFEDASDRVDGSEHRAQLFRVMMDDFAPVTRRETADLIASDRIDYFRFVLTDFVTLEDALPIVASSMRTGDGRDMSAYNEIEAEFGLSAILPLDGAQTGRDVFVARGNIDEITAVFSCANNSSFVNQSCRQLFRTQEIDVRMS